MRTEVKRLRLDSGVIDALSDRAPSGTAKFRLVMSFGEDGNTERCGRDGEDAGTAR